MQSKPVGQMLSLRLPCSTVGLQRGAYGYCRLTQKDGEGEEEGEEEEEQMMREKAMEGWGWCGGTMLHSLDPLGFSGVYNYTDCELN